MNMSFKCLAQHNRSADAEWKPDCTRLFFGLVVLVEKQVGQGFFFIIRT